MTDPVILNPASQTASDPLVAGVTANPEPDLRTDAEKETDAAAAAVAAANAKAAAQAKQAIDEQAAKDKAAADAEKAKQKAAHIVTIIGGKPAKGIANTTGNDGVPIPRDGAFTIALIGTTSPAPTHHPGMDINCVARLPEKAEIGDLVEAYCVPGLNGTSAFVHPPKKESIGVLPVSTGDNFGTGVEVPADSGRAFRKVSATAWQVLGG
jgi:hypothetical protein